MNYFFLCAMTDALKSKLVGYRIRGVGQVSDRTLILYIGHPDRSNQGLLFCPSGRCPGLFLLDPSTVSADDSPLARSFRNRIQGARIRSIEMDGFDRDVVLDLELSEWKAPRRLHFEIRGSTGNLTCIDQANGHILECLTKIPPHRDSEAPRVPGAVFRSRASIRSSTVPLFVEESTEECWNRLRSANWSGWQDLLNRLQPCTPALAQHLFRLLDLNDPSGFKTLLERVRDGMQSRNYAVCLLKTPHKTELHAIDLGFNPADVDVYSCAIDAALAWRERVALPTDFQRHREALLGSIHRQIRKTSRAIEGLQQDLESLEDGDALKRRAEMLSIHYPLFKHRVTSLELPDNDDPEKSVHLIIDPHVPLNVQIDRLFKRSTKIRRSKPIIIARIKAMSDELELLESYRQEILSAGNETDLEGVADLLRQNGIILEDGSTHVRPAGRMGPSSFAMFRSADHWTILAGRNARENDLLTFKRARSFDFWFHVKGHHGAHVVVLNEMKRSSCPDRVAEQAARIAVYFSAARGEKAVDVMMASRNQVRRAPGGVPGRVTIHRHQTLTVDSPEKTLVDGWMV